MPVSVGITGDDVFDRIRDSASGVLGLFASDTAGVFHFFARAVGGIAGLVIQWAVVVRVAHCISFGGFDGIYPTYARPKRH